VADTVEEAERFLDEHGWEWPQIRDTDRVLAKRLGADYQPYVALVDAQGEIVATLDGGGTEAQWAAMLEKLP
jgi:hypothetical protein